MTVWLFGEVPGHEFVDLRQGVHVDDPAQRHGQVSLRIDAVELAGSKQRSATRPGPGAVVIAGEEGVFSGERNRTDEILDRVGVHLDAAVIEEARQAVPPLEGVTDVSRQLGGAGQAPELRIEPGVQGLDDRGRELAARLQTALRRLAAHHGLDPVQRGDALDDLPADGRVRGARELHDAAPPMRRAMGEIPRLPDSAGVGERVVADKGEGGASRWWFPMTFIGKFQLARKGPRSRLTP